MKMPKFDRFCLTLNEGDHFNIDGEKPRLKCEIETVYKVDYSDLDEFVRLVYNLGDFNFCANQECSNDSSHEFSVSTDTISEYYTEEELDKARNGDLDDMSNGDVLDLLCLDGYIEPGTYIIDVCW